MYAINICSQVTRNLVALWNVIPTNNLSVLKLYVQCESNKYLRHHSKCMYFTFAMQLFHVQIAWPSEIQLLNKYSTWPDGCHYTCKYFWNPGLWVLLLSLFSAAAVGIFNLVLIWYVHVCPLSDILCRNTITKSQEVMWILANTFLLE